MTHHNRTFKYGIFDKDGVITNTMNVYYKLFDELAREHFGVEQVTFDEYKALNGTSWTETLKRFDATDEQIQNFLHDHDRLSIASTKIAPLFPGVQEIIEVLKKSGLTLFLSSAAPHQTVEDFTSRDGFQDVFSVALGNKKSQVDKSEHFKLFAKHVGEAEQDFNQTTFMIEDGLPGLRAAKNAGIFAVGITTNHTQQELEDAGADHVINEHQQLLDLF